MNDVLYAVRGLRRSPVFAVMTVLTLSLGIGVVTALFAVIDAVILQPIAHEQARVVRIWGNDVERNLNQHALSYAELKAFQEIGRSLERVAAINYADASALALAVDGQTISVDIAPVSVNFFEILLEAPPLFGRWITPADELNGAEPVAVVSEGFWRRVGGGDPGFVGRVLTRAGGSHPVRVIGVAPASFDYPRGADLWMPLATFYGPFSFAVFNGNDPAFRQFHGIGRLRPGVSLPEARAELDLIDDQWVKQSPNLRPTRIEVAPVLDAMLGNSRQVLWFLFAAAGLVFVIAGVNVSALLLMRASARSREMAVRLALGASRARLTRQTITESLLIGTIGAVGGIIVAQASLAFVQWLRPGDIPRIELAVIDARVLAFTLVASILWVVTFGTAPSWIRRTREATGLASEFTLRGARGTTALRIFTVAEVAAAVVIAIAAGLLVRSLVQLQGIDRGYDSRNMAVFTVLLPGERYQTARERLGFYERVVPALMSIPGVFAASPVHLGPGTGATGLSAGMIFEGQTREEARRNPWATWEPVLPTYFQTLGIPIVSGRGFSDTDGPDGAKVVIISDAVAQRYFPGQNPIGKRVRFIQEMDWTTVVGVAADTRYRELTRSWMTVYFPAAQFFFFTASSLVVRTTGSPDSLIPAIQQTIRTQEPQLAIESVASMDELAGRELSRPRIALTVASLYAFLAVMLAGIGVYGVLSYEVSQRRQELAIRSALGASPSLVFGTVVRRSLAMGAMGAAIGLALAAAATRSLRAVLYEVSPGDPVAFVVGALALVTIVVGASYVPARRAAGTNPARVLRAD